MNGIEVVRSEWACQCGEGPTKVHEEPGSLQGYTRNQVKVAFEKSSDMHIEALNVNKSEEDSAKKMTEAYVNIGKNFWSENESKGKPPVNEAPGNNESSVYAGVWNDDEIYQRYLNIGQDFWAQNEVK